jgi:hypothetical protein
MTEAVPQTGDVSIPVFVLTSGCVESDDIKFANITFSNTGVVAMNGIDVKMKGCVFGSVERREWNEIVVIGSVRDGNKVSLSNTSFERCVGEQGNGSVIHVLLEEDGRHEGGESVHPSSFNGWEAVEEAQGIQLLLGKME